MTLDVAIIGAGIAGASLAWRLAVAGQRVLLLEAEIQPGLHSTGRSAAMFMDASGSCSILCIVKVLTMARSTPTGDSACCECGLPP